MLAQSLLSALDIAGMLAFAVSGALAAARKSMDIFGFIVIAVLTSVGGGTVRDLTLGSLPVFWVQDNVYILLAIGAAVAVFFAERHIRSRLTLLTWADAAGLALFASVGAQKALALGASGLIATMMGIVTAVFGGMIRDIVCNEIPLILHREIYATAAFGAALGVVVTTALGASTSVAVIAGTVIGFVIRALAIVFGLSLPSPPKR